MRQSGRRALPDYLVRPKVSLQRKAVSSLARSRRRADYLRHHSNQYPQGRRPTIPDHPMNEDRTMFHAIRTSLRAIVSGR